MRVLLESAVRILWGMRNLHNVADRLAVRSLISRDIQLLREM